MTLGQIIKKYRAMSVQSEYVSIAQVLEDLHGMKSHQLLLKIPKDRR